jgi:hypothetical protein
MRPAKAVAAEASSPVADRVNGAEVAGAGVARPDALGRFGKFGGKYVPETLMHALTELEAAFHALADDRDFQVIKRPRFLPEDRIRRLDFRASRGIRASRPPIS